MQKERLMNDFTAVLNNFQAAQRHEKERENESVQRARMHAAAFVSLNTMRIIICLQLLMFAFLQCTVVYSLGGVL